MAKAVVDISQFRVEPGSTPDLGSFPTSHRLFKRAESYEPALAKLSEDMSDHQSVLASDRSKALLLAFQGMDAAGKDHVCRTLIKGIDPLLVAYRTFKRPTEAEYAEPFMARHERALPKLGEIGFWNRTHLEEVGTVRIHPTLLEHRGIKAAEAKPSFWEKRIQEIIETEEQWRSRNIQPVMIFLHISPEEQADRIAERAEKISKRRKFDKNDLIERGHWEEYMKYYGEALGQLASADLPRYIVPADNKPDADIISATIANHHLESLGIQFPTFTLAEETEFRDFARELRSQGKKGKGKRGQ